MAQRTYNIFQKTEECVFKIACLEDESSLRQQVDSITFEILLTLMVSSI